MKALLGKVAVGAALRKLNPRSKECAGNLKQKSTTLAAGVAALGIGGPALAAEPTLEILLVQAVSAVIALILYLREDG